ncbi:YihY/virulence factor BrkB family protein [Bradyrhizobium sp.]|uniref:YihY/virulence factor BrkB family protein n=1 Tax=Bradyrhizobium sp. TaxID=376 RepID=UPI0025BDDDF8|nr:YihY/virulence factor BrkB family protein [Bradyrhizobium sp.]
MPATGPIEIVWQAGRKARGDRVTLVSAGVAFFVLLATFPGIGATVSLYSIFADPENGGPLVAALPSVLPQQAVEIIARQTRRFAEQQGESSRSLLFVPLLGFAILLWSTTKGIRALFNALNVIHDTEEKRGFIKLTAISLVFTIGFIVFLLFVIGVVFVLPVALDGVGLGEASSLIVSLLRWPLLLVVVGLALALMYRFGSNRENAEWRWIAMGSVVASVLWVGTSILFEWFVARFVSFAELYGSLGAVIGFMIWIWLSTIVVLFGAELDAAAQRRQREMQVPSSSRSWDSQSD